MAAITLTEMKKEAKAIYLIKGPGEAGAVLQSALLDGHKCTGECKSFNGNVRHDKNTFSKSPCRI